MLSQFPQKYNEIITQKRRMTATVQPVTRMNNVSLWCSSNNVEPKFIPKKPDGRIELVSGCDPKR